MPTTKSAWKRMRTSEQNRVANRAVRSAIGKTKKLLVAAAKTGDSKQMEKALQAHFSVLDKAAKKGVIKSNTADRRKSRAALFVKKAVAAAPAAAAPSPAAEPASA